MEYRDISTVNIHLLKPVFYFQFVIKTSYISWNLYEPREHRYYLTDQMHRNVTTPIQPFYSPKMDLLCRLFHCFFLWRKQLLEEPLLFFLLIPWSRRDLSYWASLRSSFWLLIPLSQHWSSQTTIWLTCLAVVIFLHVLKLFQGQEHSSFLE